MKENKGYNKEEKNDKIFYYQPIFISSPPDINKLNMLFKNKKLI